MITHLKRIASDEFEASSMRQINGMSYDKLEFLQKQASIHLGYSEGRPTGLLEQPKQPTRVFTNQPKQS